MLDIHETCTPKPLAKVREMLHEKLKFEEFKKSFINYSEKNWRRNPKKIDDLVKMGDVNIMDIIYKSHNKYT